MGLFDGRSYSTGSVGVVRKDPHSNRTHSPARSTKSNGYFVRPHTSSHSSTRGPTSSSNSFFGVNLGGGGGHSSGERSRGFFSSSGHGSSSYYKRRPRDGYISYLLAKLKRMIRELWAYARKHPMKAFFAVVVPLVSAGGAIHGLLRQFGVRLPGGLDGGTRRTGGGYYGSSGYGRQPSGFGSSFGGGGGGLGGMLSSGGGLMENAGSLLGVARMFM